MSPNNQIQATIKAQEILGSAFHLVPGVEYRQSHIFLVFTTVETCMFTVATALDYLVNAGYAARFVRNDDIYYQFK